MQFAPGIHGYTSSSVVYLAVFSTLVGKRLQGYSAATLPNPRYILPSVSLHLGIIRTSRTNTLAFFILSQFFHPPTNHQKDAQKLWLQSQVVHNSIMQLWHGAKLYKVVPGLLRS